MGVRLSEGYGRTSMVKLVLGSERWFDDEPTVEGFPMFLIVTTKDVWIAKMFVEKGMRLAGTKSLQESFTIEQ